MTKLLLNFNADDWLTEKLETFKKRHPDLESNKEILQGYVLALIEQISGLEAQVRYLNDTAENTEGLARASSDRQGSPPDGQKALPTQEPQVLGPSSDLHTLKIGNKTYRISDTQIAKTVWKDGETTFSRKQAEALAFAESLLTIRQQKAAQMEDKKQETDRVHTEEHQKRANATVDMHRQIVQYHKRPRGIIPDPDPPYLLSACPLGRSPGYCQTNPCDKRPDCNKEHRFNGGPPKYDHGDLMEQYIR